LVTRPNDLQRTRLAVGAGRSLGGAVRRNRAKRRLRAVLRGLTPRIVPGWDVLLLARETTPSAGWPELQQAVAGLFRRAGMLTENA
jgi:ribonuclease P protein component